VLEALQQTIAGEVLTPESPGYEDARKPAIARFHDVRPAAVVRCAAPEDVLAAAGVGLPAVPRSGGHCFAGRSTTTGVVIDVGPLDDVSVSDGFATIGAGARLGKVYDALLDHGVTIPAGCGPEVGIAGLTLGGGLGIMGRRHGLTSDSLAGAEVAVGGRLVECDERREAWQGWAPGAPDELAASLVITAGPDPDEPPVVKVFGAMLGSRAETEALLSRFDPASAELVHGSHREVKRHLAGTGGPDDGIPYNRSEFFRERLPREAIAELIRHFQAGRRPGETRELDFSPWGGAYNRVAVDATAFPHRDARFLLKQAAVLEPGMAPDPWLDRSWEIVHRWGTGGVYANFPEPGLPDSAYWGANTERLSADARRWPPAGATPRPAT
jgi:hypothetical protein